MNELTSQQKSEFLSKLQLLKLSSDVSDRALADKIGISRTLLRDLMVNESRLTLFTALSLLTGLIAVLQDQVVEFNQFKSETPYKHKKSTKRIKSR